MRWFTRKSKIEKQVEAAIKVASNLYLLTIPGGEEAVVNLEFCLPDSRYRYLMFCMSATAAACAKDMDISAVTESVFGLTETVATERSQEFFGGPVRPMDAVKGITPTFHWFMNGWARCEELAKEQKHEEIIQLLSFMIHATESPCPGTESDVERLKEFVLQILSCHRPAMQRAFSDLLSH
jgi:hypothetical protein